MITATTLRRVGQLNHENKLLRQRMEDLKAENAYLLRRLADLNNQIDEDNTQHVHFYAVRMD